MHQTTVQVAEDDQYAQIRLTGRASLTCSQSLRDYGNSVVERRVPNIHIDLSECDSMDSTVMGTLAMIGLGARRNGLKAEIVNASEHNKHLLTGIGLHKIFPFTHTQAPIVDFVALCNTVSDAPDATGKAMLEAHETLMTIDPENVPRFKDVVEYLKRDLDRLKPDSDS